MTTMTAFLRMADARWLPVMAALVMGMVLMSWAPVAANGLDQVIVEGVWARPAGAGENSAIYFAITNPGAEDVELIGVETDVANIAEIHETVMHMEMVEGRISQEMQMHHIHSLLVPAGETVKLQPGGLHLMLIGLKHDLEVGQTFMVRLLAADGSALNLEVPVSQGEPRG